MSDPYLAKSVRDYDVLERLGRGGMGSVYRVRHRRIGVERAMKFVAPALLASPEAARRFEREAALLAQLEHPNVVSFHDFGVLEDGTEFLVMEYLRGESLRDRLTRDLRLPVAEAISLFGGICAGLEAMHRLGLIHRDLSPENILLASTSRGQVAKLIDLGLALPTEGDNISRLTRAGHFVGKLTYASPEQLGSLRPGETLDARSDLYSLGVVLYEALAGASPFGRQGASGAITKKLLEAAPALDRTPAGRELPPRLVALVMSLLERERDRRPRSVAAVGEALAALGRPHPAPAAAAPRSADDRPTVALDRPALPGAIATGATIGEYTLEAAIGSGGMGTVYRARHRLLGVTRALKLVKKELMADPAARERFVREARVLARLDHPALVRLYDCGALPSGEHFIVQELIVGDSLRRRLERHGRLSREEAVRLVAAAARGLGAAHAQGVVHRDVAPDNLMVVRGPDGGESIKVIDFGIAKTSALAGAEANLTSAGMFVGRPEYTSPEQAGRLEAGETLDGRSDIYSLGVVLYQALTGKLPFDAATPIAFLAKHLTTPATPPRTLGVPLPPALEALLLAMLAKERERRPQTMEDVARRLEETLVAPGAGSAVAAATAKPAARREAHRTRRAAAARTAAARPRRASAALATGAAFVALAGGGLALWSSRGGPLPPPGEWAGMARAALAAAGHRLGIVATPIPSPIPSPPMPSPSAPTLTLPTAEPPVTPPGDAAVAEPAASPCPAGMALVRAGEFWMGSAGEESPADERPRRRIHLDAFCLDALEVSNLAYERFDPDHLGRRPAVSSCDSCPAVQVSWDEAAAYCASLGRRLPTEAEWEKAARGDLESARFPWGDAGPGGGDANFCDLNCERAGSAATANDGYRHAAPAGTYRANAYGLHDMAGNAWEWVADWYAVEAYRTRAEANPEGPRTGTTRVCRGGSWGNEPAELRCAARSASEPSSRLDAVGLRCATAPQP